MGASGVPAGHVDGIAPNGVPGFMSWRLFRVCRGVSSSGRCDNPPQ